MKGKPFSQQNEDIQLSRIKTNLGNMKADWKNITKQKYGCLKKRNHKK